MFRAHIRISIAGLCTVFFIVVAVTGIISHILYDGQDPRKWYPSDGGWRYHVASSISEWIIATLFCFYILTFTDEFRDIHLEHPPLRIVEAAYFDVLSTDDTTPIISEDATTTTVVISWSNVEVPSDVAINEIQNNPDHKSSTTTTTNSQNYSKCVEQKLIAIEAEPDDLIQSMSPSSSTIIEFHHLEILQPTDVTTTEANEDRRQHKNKAIVEATNLSLIVLNPRKLASLSISIMLVAFLEVIHCLSVFLDDKFQKFSLENKFEIWHLNNQFTLKFNWWYFFFHVFGCFKFFF